MSSLFLNIPIYLVQIFKKIMLLNNIKYNEYSIYSFQTKLVLKINERRNNVRKSKRPLPN